MLRVRLSAGKDEAQLLEMEADQSLAQENDSSQAPEGEDSAARAAEEIDMNLCLAVKLFL